MASRFKMWIERSAVVGEALNADGGNRYPSETESVALYRLDERIPQRTRSARGVLEQKEPQRRVEQQESFSRKASHLVLLMSTRNTEAQQVKKNEQRRNYSHPSEQRD